MIIQDFWLVIYISLGLSLLIESPLIYARLKSRHRWVPINSAPWMIGDDHYYYSFMGLFFDRFVKLWVKKYNSIFIRKIPGSMKFQFIGFAINFIPYSLGVFIEDKRLGVLFTKIWNRIFLFVSIFILLIEIYGLFGSYPTIIEYSAIVILFFIFSPGPISLEREGLIWNVFNKKHIFNKANVNQLTRGMHSESTAPLLFLAVSMTLYSFGSQYYIITVVISVVVLYLQYYFAFAVYSLFSFALSLYSGLYLVGGIILISVVALSGYYIFTLKRCSVSTALYMHDDSGKIFSFKLSYVIEILILTIVSMLVWYVYHNIILTLLLSIFSVFRISYLSAKMQISHSWLRAAAFVVQLISVVLLVKVIHVLSVATLYMLIFFGVAAMMLYFFRNAVYLYDQSSTLVPAKYSDESISSLFYDTRDGVTFITDIVEFSYYIDLYTYNKTLLCSYWLQDKGYKEHLVDICLNYKCMMYSFDEFLYILTSAPGEWRSLEVRERIDDSYTYFHENQFIATCYRYNSDLVKDGMYADFMWTSKYVNLLSDIWESIDVTKPHDYKILRNI